jgi:hypothetical protein
MNLDVELGPGFLLVRYPLIRVNPAGDLVHGLPVASTYTGPRASAEVKAASQECLARQEMVRVFALVSLFELTQKQGKPVQKRIHDHFVGAIDFVVREQMDGRGVQADARSPTAYKIQGLSAVDAVNDLRKSGKSERIDIATEWDESARMQAAVEMRMAAAGAPGSRPAQAKVDTDPNPNLTNTGVVAGASPRSEWAYEASRDKTVEVPLNSLPDAADTDPDPDAGQLNWLDAALADGETY